MLYRHQLALKGVRSLEVNCRGRLYLLSGTEYINLGYTDAEVVLLEKMGFKDYRTAYHYCRCSNDEAMYFEHVSSRGLYKRYLRADLPTGDLLMFREVVYEKELQDYRASLGLIQLGEQADNTGDVSREENERIRKTQQQGDFLSSVMYKNRKENQLFLWNEEVYLFNTDEGTIGVYSESGEWLREVEAGYQQHPDWAGKVYQDQKTGTFYALLRAKADYALSAIDLADGAAGKPVDLGVGFYDKIVVYNKQAYVLGTPGSLGAEGINQLYVKALR